MYSFVTIRIVLKKINTFLIVSILFLLWETTILNAKAQNPDTLEKGLEENSFKVIAMRNNYLEWDIFHTENPYVLIHTDLRIRGMDRELTLDLMDLGDHARLSKEHNEIFKKFFEKNLQIHYIKHVKSSLFKEVEDNGLKFTQLFVYNLPKEVIRFITENPFVRMEGLKASFLKEDAHPKNTNDIFCRKNIFYVNCSFSVKYYAYYFYENELE